MHEPLHIMCVHWVNNVSQLSYRCITVASHGTAATSIPSIFFISSFFQWRFLLRKQTMVQHFIQLDTREPPSTTTTVSYWWRLCCCCWYWCKLGLSALLKGTLMQVVEFQASFIHSAQSDVHSWLLTLKPSSRKLVSSNFNSGCRPSIF